MGPLIFSLIPPLASLVLLILASGLFNTFVSLRLELEGVENGLIGLVVSSLYVGILIGSLRVDRLIQKLGHSRSFILFALVSMIVVLAQSLWINPWYWIALRLIGGLCMSGIFVGIESWLLIEATAKTRGVILSLYLAVFYGALSLGQFLINASDPLTIWPFYITAFFCGASTLPLLLATVKEPKIEKPVRLSMREFFHLSPVGFFGGMISGMMLAAIYGLVPVFAAEMGLSISQIGTVMAILIFGGLSLQWPLGRLADQSDRRTVLTGASLLSALFAFAIGWLVPISFPALLLLVWGFGGFSFTLYPLSMAYTCEKVADNQIIAATGGFVLSYGIGAILGPIIAPFAMDWLGSTGLFYFLGAISLILAGIGMKRKSTAAIPLELENVCQESDEPSNSPANDYAPGAQNSDPEGNGGQ